MPGPLPLLGLRAFAEVGRRGSMKAAAVALGVTPGAVSQHVKLLEARLETVLLERHNREVRPTPAGRRLLVPLAGAFQTIEDAVESFDVGRSRGRRRQTLTVTTSTSLAATWLVPRLGRFAERHPDIEVQVETTPRLVNLQQETAVDVALRHGLGDYHGLIATRFLAPRLVPVCSRTLLDGAPAIRRPIDCLRFPLLQDADRADWPLWLRAHGARGHEGLATKGPSLADDLLAARAAVAGQGIALVRDIYAEDELAAGRLVLALDRPWPTLFAYYVVTRPESVDQPKVAAFRAWVLEQAQQQPERD